MIGAGLLRLTGAIALLAAASPALASFAVPPNARGQYAPRDACSAIAGAATFLAKLRPAVAARDAEALAALASPEILLDLGGGTGRVELRKRLAPGATLWNELDRIMPLGCAYDEDSGALVLPWFFAQDLGDADPFSVNVTLGKAALRGQPSRRSSVRTSLHWQLVVIREGFARPRVGSRSL
jgi:hypothetical protein